MRQNKMNSLGSLILILPIGLVAVICLISFQDSSAFLSIFAVLVVLSAAISTILTTIQSKNAIIADHLFDKILKLKVFSGGSKPLRQNSDLCGGGLGSTRFLPVPEEVFEEPCLVLDQYFEEDEYKYMPKIIDTIECKRFDSARPERFHQNSDICGDGLGSTRLVPDLEEVFQEPCLSLDHYLEVNNFKLVIEVIDTIEWKRFELLCHLILKASGFNSRLTENGADQGVDIRVFDNNDETITLYLVQCKKWRRNRKVDRPLLQQLRGQMAAEKVQKGAYCVTSRFTLPAQEFAATNNIELFDQDKITNSFNKLSETVRRTILKELLEGDYWTPSCASCGQKFQKTKLKNGKIVWGCKNSSKHGWSSIPYYEAVPIKNVH